MNLALFEMADFQDRHPYTGRAPLGYTEEYFTPEELLYASLYNRRSFHLRGEVGARLVGLWEPAITAHHSVYAYWEPEIGAMVDQGLDMWIHSAVESPDYGLFLFDCSHKGGFKSMVICPQLKWHYIGASEVEVLMAWHDRVWPGWRALPVVADARKGSRYPVGKLPEDYPTDWRFPGAPIIEDRWGAVSRAVPGYSPWGGVAFAADNLVQFPEVLA